MSSMLAMTSKGEFTMPSFTEEVFLKGVEDSRAAAGVKIDKFKFDKTRIKILSTCTEVKENCEGIIYFMLRDCRVQDNWALLFAQKLAKKNKVSLDVVFFSKQVPELWPTKRQYSFLIKGLAEVADELKQLNIGFYVIQKFAKEELVKIVQKNNIGGVVCDFFPLREPKQWVDEIIRELPKDVTLVQVDAHNIVPCWIASDKQEVAARTLRPKINKKLSQYLHGFPLVAKHDVARELKVANLISLDAALEAFRPTVDVQEVSWAKPGTQAGLLVLFEFISVRLKLYEKFRNDAAKNATSNLSPWLHFGFISAQRCALEVQYFGKAFKLSTDSFLEELIVRRELTDNFCYYNENYDNLDGASVWARESLLCHQKDKRPYIYTKAQFESASSHEEVWNAAQRQLLQDGKMHGYMRMYWCKKILEWTNTPVEAIKIALYLNDTYSLDGSDPNGFVGVMWSICGVHDQGWTERAIFGKIRFMVEYRLKIKFNTEAYCDLYKRPGSVTAVIPPPKPGTGKRKKPVKSHTRCKKL